METGQKLLLEVLNSGVLTLATTSPIPGLPGTFEQAIDE